MTVPADGGTIEFILPKPALAMAFFRLSASLLTPKNTPDQTLVRTEVSGELQFVAVPPLGPDGANPNEAVFHFKGMIDGSDRIVINRRGALWEHVNWGWPNGTVSVNGTQWNPSEKNFMTTTGAVMLLPKKYALLSPQLEMLAGRDVVAVERTNAALIVYLNDTPSGVAPYEFKLHFPLVKKTLEPERPSVAAALKIEAVIDGSDLLKITTNGATWTHRDWGFPWAVKLNDISWDLRQTNVLANSGTNVFLPAGVDLSSAKIVSRKGRDLATMWADDDAIWVNFADNPNGADAYELEISFGQ